MQADITRSVFKNQRTTVRSCFGPGKSWTAARIALAFLFAFSNSLVVTTAPTWRQVKNIIWREMNSAHALSATPLGGRMLDTQYEIDEKWYAMGISSNKPTNFQGLHAEYVLVIVDEAAGIDDPILESIEGLLTSAHVRLLYIGNPATSSGKFYDSHKSPLFNKIRISVYDTPNFAHNNIRTVEDLKKFNSHDEITKLPLVNNHLVTPVWAWDRLQEWGETNPMFIAKVEAEFPEEGNDILIPLALVERALRKEFTEEQWKARPRNNVIGIDVARFGEDRTSFTVMDNEKVIGHDWHSGKNLMETVGKAVKLFTDNGFLKEFDRFVVDDTGLGGGVTDRLSELGYHVVAVNFGSASSDVESYINLKAEIFWCLRELFLNDKIKIMDVGRLIAEIPTIKYSYTSRSQLAIVSKQQMKKDGLKSPDDTDSLALACWGVRSFSIGGGLDTSKGRGSTIAGGLRSKVF